MLLHKSSLISVLEVVDIDLVDFVIDVYAVDNNEELIEK
jgi:hypothetical protein